MRGPSVRSRLAVLVLVPTLGLGGFAISDVVEHRGAASNASDGERHVVIANQLIDLRRALAVEEFAQGAVGTARRFGVDEATIGGLLGLKPDQNLAGSRAAVDVAQRELAAHATVPPGMVQLPDLRAGFDNGTLSFTYVLGQYSAIESALVEATGSELRTAEAALSRVSGSTRVLTATTVLTAAEEQAIATGSELDALGRLLATDASADPQSELNQLRSGMARFTIADATMRHSSTGAARVRWAAAGRDPSTVAFETVVIIYSAQAPAQVRPINVDELTTIFSQGWHSLERRDATVVAASQDLATHYHELRTASANRLRFVLALAAALAIGGLGLVLLLSKTITRPLRALSEQARRISAGDFRPVPMKRRGPPEVTEVVATFDEVREGFRTVEAQVAALADGSLTDPVLDTLVPGDLGNLLHDSVNGLARSMAESELLTRRLEHEATHDPLTQLLNRPSILAEIDRARLEGGTVVLAVDLAGFRAVNATHGHELGDRVLQIVAGRLVDTVGDRGALARVGGDEFAVVIGRELATPELMAIGHELCRTIGAPIQIGEVITKISARVGATSSGAGLESERLLREATIALATANRDGRQVVVFDDDMRRQVAHRGDIADRLAIALDDGRLFLHYQPVVTSDLVPVSAEALLRWRDHDGVMIPPDEFIPVAEASDLIIDIGRWVLKEACGALARWTDIPAAPSRLAVNLSGRHLLSLTVVDDVRVALDRAEVDPGRLTIEITETVLLTDLPLATQHLDQLRALGVTVAVDDFGTGYTSIGQLRQLPVDILKIDRSLVVAADERVEDQRILDVIVTAAHAMEMTVVAEGIETDRQLDLVRSAGCDAVQGYLVARPSLEADFLREMSQLASAVPSP